MKYLKYLVAVVMLFNCSIILAKDHITLDGAHLSLAQAWQVANGDVDVKIAPASLHLLQQAYDLVLAGAVSGTPVYGLTVGVGLNKDHQLFDAQGNLSADVLDASRKFNAAMLRAHSAGVGPMMPERLVRLAMVIRLNTMLTGRTGVQPYVAELYEKFLNLGISPVIPSRGTTGDGDIMLASHVGLVMMGEWQAHYKGQLMSGAEALKSAQIKPLIPQGKDGLAILSNNSVSAAYAIDAVQAARQTLAVSPIVFGLSLEGLNGNVAPILPQTVGVRPFPLLAETAATMRSALKGSYLWDKNADRPLQDPLSFRTTVYTLSEAGRALTDAEAMLTIQINSSDDNPAVIVEADPAYKETSQVAQYFVDKGDIKGAIIPTANFEPLPMALAIQRLTLALAHVSHNSVQRSIHLEEDHFTGLPRFLAAKDNQGHAFGSLHVPFVALHAENVDLANPVSLDIQPVAGGIEDTGTNLDRTAKRLRQVVENIDYIYGIELMHSTQAIDLRKLQNPNLKLGEQTGALFTAYRKLVPFVDQDRVFTPDIEASKVFLENYSVK